MSDKNATSVVPTRILVPIDFSPSSHAALDAATELAEKFHAEIYLLSVIPSFPNVSLPDSITENAVIERARKEAEVSGIATIYVRDAGVTPPTWGSPPDLGEEGEATRLGRVPTGGVAGR